MKLKLAVTAGATTCRWEHGLLLVGVHMIGQAAIVE